MDANLTPTAPRGASVFIDTGGAVHASARCEEVTKPILGSVPVDSRESRSRSHCADCTD